MDITKAHSLAPGDHVSCPADRGDAAYRGTVTQGTGGVEHTSHQGVVYATLSVRHPKTNHVSLWPTNRLQ